MCDSLGAAKLTRAKPRRTTTDGRGRRKEEEGREDGGGRGVRGEDWEGGGEGLGK